MSKLIVLSVEFDKNTVLPYMNDHFLSFFDDDGLFNEELYEMLYGPKGIVYVFAYMIAARDYSREESESWRGVACDHLLLYFRNLLPHEVKV